jgi:hypothetical protein
MLMCFSAPASFTAGAALLIVGAATVRRARTRSELPYAWIPVLFGIQQWLEGALWLTFPDRAPLLNTMLTHAYSFFSHVLWPVYVPLAGLALETVPWRRRVLIGFALAGSAVGLYLLVTLFTLPIVATVTGRHIAYESPHFYALVAMSLYLLGTCASLMFSSHLGVVAFGVAAFASAVAAYAFYATWFISVWCFFAGVLSVLVLLYFTDPRRAAVAGGATRRLEAP